MKIAVGSYKLYVGYIILEKCICVYIYMCYIYMYIWIRLNEWAGALIRIFLHLSFYK